MKNYLFFILLFTSSAGWAQTPTTHKADSTYTVVDQMPQYPGGDEGLMTFLQKHIRYPVDAKKNKIEGKVYVSFIVDEDGNINDIKIVSDIGGGCGDEVVRVVKQMPSWKPGKEDGEPVKVKFMLPISFQLPKD